jgi:UDP-2,4-diacetamido-2,4,6-trideoxy-beta-L-altropyranose hydrolase
MKSKKIFFRVDASYEIGTGHVMRCLTLANLFTKIGIDTMFICRDLPGNLNHLIVDRGYKLCILPYPTTIQQSKQFHNPYEAWLEVDWKIDLLQTVNMIKSDPSSSCLIIDHYSIDSKWENLFHRLTGKKIIVIDDLANRSHFCQIILDQNISNRNDRYDDLVPKSCVKFLGLPYVILREDFLNEKINLRKRNGMISRILVFFGGSDPTNETFKTIQVLKNPMYSEIHIDIVVGDSNKNKEMIKSLCNEVPNFYYHCQINNMAELMVLADLSIGAGGTTTWERCYLGLPTLTIVTADNQIEIINLVNDKGAICNLGESSKVTQEKIEQKLNLFIKHPLKVKMISQRALDLMDENKLNRFIERVVDSINDTN